MTVTIPTTTSRPAARAVDASVPVSQTLSQTTTLAWRALVKMSRNPEQLVDVTAMPVLFTVMFGLMFGGAVSGSTAHYLPTLIPGIIAMTTITACVGAGIQLREDMDKGVFDRFRSLPIARIAPLAGPMMADLARYAIAAGITLTVGIAHGLPPRWWCPRCARRSGPRRHHRLVHRLDLPVDRHQGQECRRRPGDVHDDHVPLGLPVQRLRTRRHPPGMAPDRHADQSGLPRRVGAARPDERRCFTAQVGWACSDAPRSPPSSSRSPFARTPGGSDPSVSSRDRGGDGHVDDDFRPTIRHGTRVFSSRW